MAMQKEKRHNAIFDLITTKKISTQEDLTDQLKKKGFFVNQSSVSRDLIELGIVKVNGAYSAPGKSGFANFGLLSMDTAGENLVVAKTEAGMASAVCVRIDHENFEEIVGTIAGEDTIFIAVKDKRNQKMSVKKIWELFDK